MEPTTRERRDATALLARVPEEADRVFLLGDRLGGADGPTAWLESSSWPQDPRGCYLEGEHPVIRLARPDDGRPLELLRAAAWYGPGDYSPGHARQAWELLEGELRRAFDEGAELLASPATTGRDLFLRSIPNGREWPTLSLEHQALIRSTTGQGRIEMFPRAFQGSQLEQLIGYDGRAMYAALCRELPTGAVEHRRVSEYLGYTRARYNATAHVPADWNHACRCGAPGHPGLGLLGQFELDGHRWEYPSAPGRSFSGWWDGAEVHVALEHGWTFTFHTALVWERSDSRQGPLDGWARRLNMIRDRLLEVALRGGLDKVTPARLAGRATRAIILHAIGAFYAGSRQVTGTAPVELADQVPADAANLRVEGDSLVWSATVEPAWPELCHPEWSAAVWARARARLLTAPTGTGGVRAGALHVPTSSLIAFRTDAIYLDHDPAWPDDGAAGRFRRTVRRQGPLEAPRTAAELLEAVR